MNGVSNHSTEKRFCLYYKHKLYLSKLCSLLKKQNFKTLMRLQLDEWLLTCFNNSMDSFSV